MEFRSELQKRLEKKRSEIVALQGRLKEATIYAQALEDTLRLLPGNENGPPGGGTSSVLREGSLIARAREAIQKAGRPLHISDLLKAMGRPIDKGNRAAMASSIGAYVRKSEIFTRTGPNVFGLVEMQNGPAGRALVPPPNFGIDEPPAVHPRPGLHRPMAVRNNSSMPYRGMGARQAAIEFLRAKGAPEKNSALARALLDGGYQTKSEAFRRTLFNTLKNDSKRTRSEIVKREDGWALKVWNKEGDETAKKSK